MWRAFFLAMGISLFLLGAESLVIDQAVLVPKKAKAAETEGFSTSPQKPAVVVRPPEWVPWTFMSLGTVIVLYSFTVPRRVAG